MKTTVFLGGGRITTALLAGLRLAGYKNSIIVYDRHAEKLRRLKREFGVKIDSDLHRAVDQAELLIIAVRPDSVVDLLRDIGPIKRALTTVSLAAGVPLSKLRAGLKPPVGWVRAMPSPACRSGHGLTGITFDRHLPSAERRLVKAFFANVGPVLEVAESKFDVFTVTYSCSHGYHALGALAEAAQAEGLDRKTALTAAAHALADGIIAWREGKIPLEDLIHEAATPGGIAATVMLTMNRAGHARVVSHGLRAGIHRARRNARK
ncbi:MAG TPA: NAD(P)-binding domain-containing protein [Terriglobales bacterium]|nr:NAD(P)-binding domain-containing protein [Terriglobales bacterium]